MKILVQKFGGTSVANVQKIKTAAKRISKAHKSGYRVVVVVSALGKTTDSLVALSKEMTSDPSRREMDMLLSTGEQISTALMAMALHNLKLAAVSLTGNQVGIQTDSEHTRARILRIKKDRILKELTAKRIVIVTGFQGCDSNQEITTLGRGGSDLTAVALAHSLNAEACEIYTDVDGIYTTDPRVLPTAKKIKKISYEEMLELASAGAQVMQARSIEMASKFNIPIHVRSSIVASQGTWIVKGDKDMEKVLVSGVSLNKKEAKITLIEVSDKPGVAGRIFRAIAKAGVNVDVIVQNVSIDKKSTNISFTVPREDVDVATKAIAKVKPLLKKSQIVADKNIAKISIVGIGMRSHSGVAADMFEVLGKSRINIDMISTSEIKICCVVKKKDADRAIKVLHDQFVTKKDTYAVEVRG
ncbi:MAG: aspartate kinase [Candidatus Omnitrophota bacterium]|jgi:aspartate kinase